MTYHEYHIDLFGTDKRYVLAHCISADFSLGAGIARAFSGMGVGGELFMKYTGEWKGNGYCLLTSAGTGRHRGVLNLVTKERCNHKPTYGTLRQALRSMKEVCRKNGINAVAMPKIASGLDKLEWNQVSAMIHEEFADIDMEILVCVR